MAENKGNRAEKEAYVRQLAALCAQTYRMTDEQKQLNAEKIAELKKRVASLPDAWKKVYQQELKKIVERDASNVEKTAKSAAKAAKQAYEALEEEFDNEDEYEEDAPKKKHGFLITVIVLLVLAGAVFGGWLWYHNEVNGNRGDVVTQTVTIEKGSGVRTIGKQLKEADIIRSTYAFFFYVRGQEDAASKLQYGTFELASDMSYDDIIAVLQQTTDERETVRVTFPEGKTAIQYAQIMEQAGLCSAEEFLEVANETGDFSQFKFWNQRGEHPNTFMRAEGYLFPDTYEFFVGDSVYNMVAKIYGEFDRKITDEMYQRMNELKMPLADVITLASLVQEEAGNEYSKQVSAVFHNRLRKGITLGSNVAWDKEKADDNNYIYDSMAGAYGFGSWDAIPEEMRAAYDTYTHQGLPAGPVSNPGILAIEAALWPEENCNYLFFQTDTLGNYHFANTNAEHEAITAQLEKEGIRP